MAGATEAVRRFYEQSAPDYDRRIRRFERLALGDGRRWACSQATGRVLELAVGTGRNLGCYPPSVSLTGIELSPAMLAIARRRAAELRLSADLREGDASALEFPDGSFDAVVCTLALCTIPDEVAAIREAHRVLRPGGRLILLEHVRSPQPVVRALQRLLQPLFCRLASDNLTRDPLDHLEREGFAVEIVARSKLGFIERVLARRA